MELDEVAELVKELRGKARNLGLPRVTFSKEVRKEVLNSIVNSGRSMYAASKVIDLHTTTLYQWNTVLNIVEVNSIPKTKPVEDICNPEYILKHLVGKEVKKPVLWDILEAIKQHEKVLVDLKTQAKEVLASDYNL